MQTYEAPTGIGAFPFLITSWLSSHTGFRVHGADQIRVPSWSNIMADAIIRFGRAVLLIAGNSLLLETTLSG